MQNRPCYATHTPGDWQAYTGWIGLAPGKGPVIAEVPNYPYGHSEPDITLMAAAKELLAALEDALAVLECNCSYSRDQDMSKCLGTCTRGMAEAAVLKAKYPKGLSRLTRVTRETNEKPEQGSDKVQPECVVLVWPDGFYMPADEYEDIDHASLGDDFERVVVPEHVEDVDEYITQRKEKEESNDGVL